jgi:hypothetical protein
MERMRGIVSRVLEQLRGRGQIAYNRLLRLIQTGEVRGQRIGKRWFVDLTDLARWKREREPAPA